METAHEDWREKKGKAKEAWRVADKMGQARGYAKAVEAEKLAQDKKRGYRQEKASYKEMIRRSYTPEQHRHGRNAAWRHLDSFDILSMPDPWEYPWFAAWDLAFHSIPWARLDPAFAKYQLIVLLREWFLHPNGALPAYEWNFDDVNPPVHVLAALSVFQIDGARDIEFLERVFQKLLINFTWWLNREDPDGNNLFGGGFLGLDNISAIDRSHLPPDFVLEQADGTAWMAHYALGMLVIAVVLADRNPVYDDMVVKFGVQFVMIADALNRAGIYDQDDGFFYDLMQDSSGVETPIKVQTLVGAFPLLPSLELTARHTERSEWLQKRLTRAVEAQRLDDSDLRIRVTPIDDDRRLVTLVSREQLSRAFKTFFDESAFLSPHGLRSLSKRHSVPYQVPGVPGAEIAYEPAESRTAMYGGNSNWRGPVWFPINYMVISALRRFHESAGEGFTVEYPTGSGRHMTLAEIAQDLSERLVAIWLPGPDGRRPVYGGIELFQSDPAWRDNLLFFEYFNGDDGAGLGASHQTGWTALVAELILDPAAPHPQTK